MPVVRVALWAEHSSTEMKQAIAREMTATMHRHLGCTEQSVVVLFEEVPKESWAIGGELASELFPAVCQGR